ncbi:DUF4406 domain-containing protein [Pseudomonas yamanorum]|uniref:DUF4406 domain-containing protein n=1 Tax=Pseudomonas yamanorum TaxID=515393 RepID=UPI003B9EC9E8
MRLGVRGHQGSDHCRHADLHAEGGSIKHIYLSGPMTGLPGLNYAAFHAMTTNLRAGGHTVTNPAELNPDGGSWNDCMRRDIAVLMDCDTVATPPGR